MNAVARLSGIALECPDPATLDAFYGRLTGWPFEYASDDSYSVGEAADAPPDKLDAAIMFAPAGELVPPALKALKKAGVLVLGGIHMSPIPEFDYDLLYEERVIRSVANNTRNDGKDFLRVAAEIPIRSEVTLFPLREANRALNDLKADRINGAAVLDCRQ